MNNIAFNIPLLTEHMVSKKVEALYIATYVSPSKLHNWFSSVGLADICFEPPASDSANQRLYDAAFAKYYPRCTGEPYRPNPIQLLFTYNAVPVPVLTVFAGRREFSVNAALGRTSSVVFYGSIAVHFATPHPSKPRSNQFPVDLFLFSIPVDPKTGMEISYGEAFVNQMAEYIASLFSANPKALDPFLPDSPA